MLSKKTPRIYQNSEMLFYQDLIEERSSAFNHLYLETYKLCIPYAVNKGSGQDEAEDLLQECLAIFVEKLRDGSYVFQEGAKITTYFYRIYGNQWQKLFEKKMKLGEVRLQINNDFGTGDEDVLKSETPSFTFLNTTEGSAEQMLKLNQESLSQSYDENERTWIFKKLNRAFVLLADDCQKVLTWFYVEDWALKQIAEALNMTEASATVKRFKCAKYLKEKFRLV